MPCKTDFEGKTTVLQSNDCCSLLATDALSSRFPHIYKSVQTGRLTQLKTAVAVFYHRLLRQLQAWVPFLRALIPFFPFSFSSGEFSRQINDFKIKLQKAEQDNARLEGLVSKL